MSLRKITFLIVLLQNNQQFFFEFLIKTNQFFCKSAIFNAACIPTCFCCIQTLSFSELSVSPLKHYGTDKQSIKPVQIIVERRKIIQTEDYIGPRGIKRDKTTRFLKLF